MAPNKKKGPRQFIKQQQKRSKLEDVEIKELERVLKEQAPPRGSNPLMAAAAPNKDQPTTLASARKFEDLPLSQRTKDALKSADFKTLTAIQRAALPHALCGRDVLGAAKTGSGKTLAFLIPLVEVLFRQKWNRLDGLGALVISPTRELALQIFEELRKVGRRHELSAGLLIGGKDVREEAERVAGMNILVATPGRLLQHMDETPGFDAPGLQILVLDEADRILDMGFSATLNAIVANLPRSRQTLLFSATQTKSVSALARLSLKDPEYVEAHAEAAAPTPLRLQQAVMEVSLPDKMDTLWSFIRSHLRQRTIVFFSTCKQVKFVYEALRRLRPGVPLRALHGRMAQARRAAVYADFCADKAAVLFATDVAARGLDFPSVDWVVQFDCPEDVATYIHRVGRTARYTSAGRSLMLLDPSERSGMMAALAARKVPVKELRRNPEKQQPVGPALQALLSKDKDLKEQAQRAVTSYLRSVFLQPDKTIFDVSALPAAEFALSMGLPSAPKLRFLRRAGGAAGKQSTGEKAKPDNDSDDDDDDDTGHSSGSSDDEDEDGGNSDSESDDDSEQQQNIDNGQLSDDNDDDLLVVKRRDIYNASVTEQEEKELLPNIITTTAAKTKKKKLKIYPSKSNGTRVVFDDDGQAVDPLSLLGADEDDSDDQDAQTGHATVAERATAARAVLAARDAEDRAKLRKLRKEQRDAKRARRLAREAANIEEGAAFMAGSESEEDEEQDDGRIDDFSNSGSSSSGSDDEDDRDLLLDSDDDSELQEQGGKARQIQKKRPHAEVAHLGMLPASNIEQNDEKKGSKKKKVKRDSRLDSMSLADKEALALALLRK